MDVTSEMLSDILYEKEIGEITELIGKSDAPTLMHMIAYNYNWDNGLDVPKSIINNPHCDAGTALMIFELAEGYEFLLGEECVSDTQFLQKLKDMLTDGKFTNNNIRYVPELDRMQKYRLKKSIPDIPAVFLDGTGGDEIEIITV
ncbi:MAG: DUF4274 domain-containing protein [Ruminococcus sp.]|nr:DUF4274 domain-containing protein [Ruminococcus sp.]